MVKFRKAFRNYNKGEIAGFSKQHEAWLVSKNIADRITVKKEEPNGEVNKPATGAVKGKAGDTTDNGGATTS
jgi:hypothetical protein